MNRIQTRQAFVQKLLDSEVFEEQDKLALMNMKLEKLALMVQNVWSAEARAAAIAARHQRGGLNAKGRSSLAKSQKTLKKYHQQRGLKGPALRKAVREGMQKDRANIGRVLGR